MRLRDLHAYFIAATDTGWHRVNSIEKANGVMFQCPKCAVGKEIGENECECGESPHAEWCGFGGRHRKGAHSVVCWFRNPRALAPVGPERDPKPGRWWISDSSTSFDNLTFEHGEPPIPKSVQLIGGGDWHGYVENGGAE